MAVVRMAMFRVAMVCVAMFRVAMAGMRMASNVDVWHVVVNDLLARCHPCMGMGHGDGQVTSQYRANQQD